MRKGNVKVELNPQFSGEDRNRDLKYLISKFRQEVSDFGVIQNLKDRKSYESRGRKRRRKEREAELARLKAALKENFKKKDA